LPCGMISGLSLASDFACFSARFSLIDLPDFFDMCCRGDLSPMAVTLPAWGLDGSVYLDGTARARPDLQPAMTRELRAYPGTERGVELAVPGGDLMVAA